jgi:hypothetical protein
MKNASDSPWLDDSLIIQLWRRMTTIFGHKWHSHLGAAVLSDGRLSDAAKTWQRGLAGVNVDQLRRGFAVLVDKGADWPPALPEFKRFCLVGDPALIPPLAQVVSWIANAYSRQGCIADRFVHPLAFAVSSRFTSGNLVFKNFTVNECTKLVKPFYEFYCSCGWPDFPEWAYEVQAAVGCDKPEPSRDVALDALKQMRGHCG